MSSTSIKAPPVRFIALAQCVATLILALVFWVLWGRVSAYSMMLGGLISTVPNAIYARQVFRYRGARAMTQVVKAIYMGEFIKLTLMGSGFALAFTLVEPLDTKALFAGFVLVHGAGIAALAKIQAYSQH